MVREPVQLGHPSHLSCPQCGGVLNEVTDASWTRFRCQIGHAFTAEALLAAQDEVGAGDGQCAAHAIAKEWCCFAG